MKARCKVRFLPVLLLALSLFSPGCAATSGPQDPGAPVPVRLKEPLKLGQVDIVLYQGMAVNQRRDEEIMALVSQRILEQRNIAMQLHTVYTGSTTGTGPDAYVRQQAALGKPPQIMAGYRYGGWGLDMPPVLKLNEALTAYGPNLTRQISADVWKEFSIGDSIVAIPAMELQIYPCMYANKSTLQAHSWQIPTTEAQFEALLAEAKQASVRPIDGSWPGWATEWFGIRGSDQAWLDDQGKVHPLTDSPEYDAYLNTMRRWHDAGYFMDPPKEGDTNYLFSSGHWATLAEDDNLVPLPLISMAGLQAVAAPAYGSRFVFESFSKPEAVVTLLDWVYEQPGNHELISKGEKDKDYRIIGDSGGYQLLGRDQYEHSQWGLQVYLSMDGFNGHPIADCHNPEGIRQSIAYQEAAARPSRFLSIPSPIRRYALPGTALRMAADPAARPAEENMPATSMADDYVQGNITREKYDQLMKAQPDRWAQACVDILQRMLDKTYDPPEDMYKPAEPVANN